jgi:RNA polymerase sigma factor (sigma-70 family)
VRVKRAGNEVAEGPPDSSARQSDAAVIVASLTEPERFAELFDRHAAGVHRYVARRLGREAAGDLVGETFLVAFGKRQRYDPGVADARPWLFGIATRLVGQHRRDEVRRYRLRLALPPEETRADTEQIAARVSAEAVRVPLAEAVAALTPGDRDVLLLIAWEQFSYAEVAAALDIPVGTVRSRLSRARAQVRAALGGTDPTKTFEYEEQARWTT